MNNLLPIILFISIVSGQLVKLPVNGFSGPTLFDLIIFIFCLIGLIQIKGNLQQPNKIITAALFFSGVCFASLLLSPLNLNFSEKLNSFMYIVRFFGFVLFYWIISSGGLFSIKQNILNIFFYSSLVLASLGLIQILLYPDLMFLSQYGWDPHYVRVVSTFLDPNFLGTFLTIGLLLLLTKQVEINSKFYKLFLIIIYTSFILTFSRGSALMMFASFFTLSILLKSFNMFKITFLFSLGFAISFFAYTTFISAPRNIDRIQSASYRIDSWQQGITMFQTYPILGVGFNTYKYALDQLGLVPNSYTKSRGATTNDSSFIYVFATTGIIGFGFYLYFIWQILKTNFDNFKNGGKIYAVFFASTVGLILQSFFSNTLFYPFLLFWLLLPAISLKTSR